MVIDSQVDSELNQIEGINSTKTYVDYFQDPSIISFGSKSESMDKLERYIELMQK